MMARGRGCRGSAVTATVSRLGVELAPCVWARGMVVRSSWIGLVLSVGLSGCDRAPRPATKPAEPSALQSAAREAPKPATPEALAGKKAACEARLERVKAEPALAGAPGFEAHRAELLARSKSEAVLFRRAPEPDLHLSVEVQTLRAQLAKSPSPG